jgi:hypothetical protein
VQPAIRDLITRLLDATGLGVADLDDAGADRRLQEAAAGKGGEADYWYKLLRERVGGQKARGDAIRAVARDREKA